MAKKRAETHTFGCAFCGSRISSTLEPLSYVGNPPRARKILRCPGCGSENVWHAGRDTLDPWRAARRIADANQDEALKLLGDFVRTALQIEATNEVVESDFRQVAKPILEAIDANDRARARDLASAELQRLGELGPVQNAYLSLLFAERMNAIFPSQRNEILAGVLEGSRAAAEDAITKRDWARVKQFLIAMELDKLHAHCEMVAFFGRDVVPE